MALTAGELEILITANTKELDQLKSKLNGVQASASKASNIFSGFQGIMVGVGAAMIGAGLALKSFVDKASEMENLNAEFKVMLGSSQKASELIAKIKTLAAATPFETTDLVQNTKVLLQFGIAQKDVISTLNMLGDVAGNSKERLSSLALVFGQISSAGKLQGQDLMQLINVGFNPLQILAQKSGKSMADLRKEMEKGNITFAMVKDAFKIATSEGGLFFNNMKTQSETFTGRVSTMQDEFNNIAVTIGTAFLPLLKEIVIVLTENAKSINDFLRSAKGIEFLSTTMGRIAGTFAVMKIIFQEFGKMIQENVLSVMQNLQKNFTNVNKKGEEGSIIFGILAYTVKLLGIGFSVITKVINLVVTGIFNLVSAIKEGGQLIGDFFLVLTGKKKWEDVKKSADETVKAVEKLALEGVSGVDDIIKTTIDSFKKFPDDTKKLQDDMINSWKETNKEIGDMTTKALSDGITEGIAPLSDLDRLLQSVGIVRQESVLPTLPNQKIPEKVTMKLEMDISAFEESGNKIANLLGKIQNTFTSAFQNVFNAIIETTQKTTESIEETQKKTLELKDKGFSEVQIKGVLAFQKIATAIIMVGQGVQSVLGAVQGYIDQFYQQQIEGLQTQHDAEIEAVDTRLAKEIELIENNGITKEEMLQKEVNDLIAAKSSETDASKVADIDQQLSAKQKELAVLQATKKANDEKLASDKKFAQEKYKIEKQAFETKKAMDIIQATISYALGLVSLWSNVWSLGVIPGAILGGVMTGVLTGIYAAQVAMIASQSPPPPPAFAKGTLSAPGGTALVGEEGAELVNLPQGSQVFPANITSSLTQPQQVNVRVFIGEKELRDVVATTNIENKRDTKNR